jgi:hypothetical protein
MRAVLWRHHYGICGLSKEYVRIMLVESRVWQFLISILIKPAQVVAQTLYPVYLVHKSKKVRPSVSGGESMQPLLTKTPSSPAKEKYLQVTSQVEELISNPETNQLLQRFLEREFSVENPFFVEECRLYKNLSMDPFERKKALKALVRIQEVFLDKIAISRVNISGALDKKLWG